jgi:hypothetical protein
VKEWITIAEAAVLVGRHRSRIYAWIDQGRLATRVNAEGVTEILAKAVRRIESEVKRGRPRGVPTKR